MVTNNDRERGLQAGERLAGAVRAGSWGASSAEYLQGEDSAVPPTSQARVWPGSGSSGETVVRGRTPRP